ncbi:unnamed protein product [Paramecium primaurelia]|uniref:Uncharacterized protein n=1 Tax=Paramecium primaurelia TaxID=5886 RepID=A0A8S1Q9M5_PARPR|nr:unnamed protein product [Paramecium primaurelia]
MQKNDYGFDVDEKLKEIHNKHSDEAIKLKEEDDQEVGCGQEDETNVYQAGARGAKQAAQSVVFQEEKVSLPVAQIPNDYSNLQVGAEVKQLFEFIARYFHFSFKLQLYKVPQIVLDAILKPFIPDYAPETIGLFTLDQSAINQSQIRFTDERNVKVINRGKKYYYLSYKKLTTQRKLQIIDVAEMHKKQQPSSVSYSKLCLILKNQCKSGRQKSKTYSKALNYRVTHMGLQEYCQFLMQFVRCTYLLNQQQQKNHRVFAFFIGVVFRIQKKLTFSTKQ